MPFMIHVHRELIYNFFKAGWMYKTMCSLGQGKLTALYRSGRYVEGMCTE